MVYNAIEIIKNETKRKKNIREGISILLNKQKRFAKMLNWQILQLF